MRSGLRMNVTFVKIARKDVDYTANGSRVKKQHRAGEDFNEKSIVKISGCTQTCLNHSKLVFTIISQNLVLKAVLIYRPSLLLS